jgi:membrane-associated HD superfamily phosphohydrolase
VLCALAITVSTLALAITSHCLSFKNNEFKKAWLQMVYAIVGIFVVGFAWAAVKLVSGLNI